MSSGDDIKSGNPNGFETTTSLVGQKPDPPNVDFNGGMFVLITPLLAPIGHEPNAPKDGLVSAGVSASASGLGNGRGVVGLANPIPPLSPPLIPPANDIAPAGIWGDASGVEGVGVVGKGGGSGAGIIGVAAGASDPSLLLAGPAGVFGLGGPAQNVGSAFPGGPPTPVTINAGPGIFGQGGTAVAPDPMVPGTIAIPAGPGVVGIAGDVGMAPPLASISDVGTVGISTSGVGTVGISTSNDAVVGNSGGAGKSGVFGFNTSPTGPAFGVSGNTSSPGGAGVNGFSATEVGVFGRSDTNDAVVGASGGAGKSGVFGFNTSLVVGAGIGVAGHSNTGYGGTFESVDAQGVTHSAQMRIVPAGAPGLHVPPFPANPQIGDFFVQSVLIPERPPRREGRLWFFANVPAGTPHSQNGWVQIV